MLCGAAMAYNVYSGAWLHPNGNPLCPTVPAEQELKK